MKDILLKIIMLLGIVFCLGVLQGEVIAEDSTPTEPNGESTDTEKKGKFEIRIAEGFFIRTLHDEFYGVHEVENEEKIKLHSVKDDFTVSSGALLHVFLPKSKINFLALTAGFGLNGPDLSKNLQMALGGSFLFHTTQEEMFALTFGGILGKVRRLDGYSVGDKFTAEGEPPTKLVYKHGWFGGLTYTIKFSELPGLRNIFNTEAKKAAAVAKSSEEKATKAAADAKTSQQEVAKLLEQQRQLKSNQ